MTLVETRFLGKHVKSQIAISPHTLHLRSDRRHLARFRAGALERSGSFRLRGHIAEQRQLEVENEHRSLTAGHAWYQALFPLLVIENVIAMIWVS